ncbi:MAG: CDP-glycerol glycerophosphotransferase family protein [Defluviitaleaceae bacterium]|nr:CDP-glycerol glycerophosphotransferase family protein [Defluviitaleaceae bacterium]MCL2239578.1 CDP-glycerol glycerophosphotransferase family protein [Defluviitaleaceae bacterium]
MRKHQNRQILDLLETIEQAQSARLYASCQEGALSLCDFIDSIMGEGTEAVDLLMKHCEFLFKANNGELDEKNLRKHFIKVSNHIRHHLKPSKTEMVFISYKASMSDSLETIYLAAKADPNCNAIWLPVPYLEFNSDGSISKTIYEGQECYPPHMECIDWQLYDIEARRPDAIFTFNPYDGGNVVTSIHPNFYCERLRNLTDMLVYVPYFVVSDHLLAHFATPPGCAFAHRVIIQSDTIRDQYIEYFTNAYGNNFGKPEDKFVTMGSPKLDKVVNAKREDFTLPETWRDLIGNKKVIFYNSSIGSVLTYNELYLQKLQHVLKTFQNRNDIVLWWRPHPLNKATYKSMRPQLISVYEKLVNDYIKDGWGIYDDTPDLHRAIAWTDGYYGDRSSVLILYLATGKPIMLKNILALTEEKHPVLQWLYPYKDTLLAYVKGINVIGTISGGALDISKSFVSNESNYVTMSEWSHQSPVEVGDKLYFPPFASRELICLSKDNDIAKNIEIDAMGCANGLFTGGVAQDKYVYLSPLCHPAIAKIDTETDNITYYPGWMDELKKHDININDLLYCAPAVTDGRCLWFATKTNIIISFDTDTCKYKAYQVGKKEYAYNTVCYDGENYWLTPYINTKTPLIKWHPENGIINETDEIYDTREATGAFRTGYFSNGYIWLFPIRSPHVIKVNVSTNIVEIVNTFAQDCQNIPSGVSKFSASTHVGNYFYLLKEYNSTYVAFNCETMEREDGAICYSQSDLTGLAPRIASSFSLKPEALLQQRDALYYESNTIQLSDYLNYITIEPDEDATNSKRISIAQLEHNNANGVSGKQIYEYTMQVL